MHGDTDTICLGSLDIANGDFCQGAEVISAMALSLLVRSTMSCVGCRRLECAPAVVLKLNRNLQKLPTWWWSPRPPSGCPVPTTSAQTDQYPHGVSPTTTQQGCLGHCAECHPVYGVSVRMCFGLSRFNSIQAGPKASPYSSKSLRNTQSRHCCDGPNLLCADMRRVMRFRVGSCCTVCLYHAAPLLC